MNWWMSNVLDWYVNGQIVLVSWIVWVVVSITLHELGHGWMAIKCGDDIPLHSGHMTLNPLVHIPPMAWVAFMLFGFTWGLMPVQPMNFRGRYDDAKVAFAGPAVNLILFTFCILADIAWLKAAPSIGDPLAQNVHTFLYIGAKINLMGFLFNLIPIPPLDGSRILGDFFPRYSQLFQNEKAAIVTMIGMMLLFTIGGRILWGIAEGTSLALILAGSKAAGASWFSPYLFP